MLMRRLCKGTYISSNEQTQFRISEVVCNPLADDVVSEPFCEKYHQYVLQNRLYRCVVNSTASYQCSSTPI